MHQTGEFCRPDVDCQDYVGYSQGYAANAASGWAFSASAGYRLKRLRLELTAVQHGGSMNSGYHFSGHYNATQDQEIVSVASAGSLTTQTIAFGLYRDMTAGAATSYLGAGIGLTRTATGGTYYEPVYSCGTELACAKGRSLTYDQQAFNLRGWGISRHLYGGVDYDIGEPFLLGMKLAYNFFADVREASRDNHSPEMRPSDTSVGGINRLSFSVGIKYALGK